MVAALALLAGSAGCDNYNPNQRLAILDVESGRSRTISPGDRSVSMAVWSPDSEAVLVQEGWAEGRAIVRRNATTGTKAWEVFGKWETEAPAAATFSPDGEQVALLRMSFSGAEAGSSVEMLDAESGEPVGEGPVWSVGAGVGSSVPMIHEIAWNDARLAVISARGSLADLFLLDPADDWSATTGATAGNEYQLSASPAGEWLAVLGSEGLALWGPDGTSSVIRDVVEGNIDFDFSPDGTRLVLAADEQIAVYTIATGEWDLVAQTHSLGVSWGANDLIAWAWGADIVTIRPDGSERSVIVHVSGGKSVRHPEWSPDGTKLAYVVQPPYRD